MCNSIGCDLKEAQQNAYNLVNNVNFEGAFYRSDIGFKGIKWSILNGIVNELDIALRTLSKKTGTDREYAAPKEKNLRRIVKKRKSFSIQMMRINHVLVKLQLTLSRSSIRL